jgi:hypothetical protein
LSIGKLANTSLLLFCQHTRRFAKYEERAKYSTESPLPRFTSRSAAPRYRSCQFFAQGGMTLHDLIFHALEFRPLNGRRRASSPFFYSAARDRFFERQTHFHPDIFQRQNGVRVDFLYYRAFPEINVLLDKFILGGNDKHAILERSR